MLSSTRLGSAKPLLASTLNATAALASFFQEMAVKGATFYGSSAVLLLNPNHS